MSLRATLLSILTLVLMAFAAGMWLVQRTTMLPGYLALEHDLAVADVKRIEAALRAEIESVDKITRDWANWDDTYRFVVEPYDEYRNENLSQDYISSGNFHGAWFLRTDGALTFGVMLDPDREWQPLPIAELDRPQWSLDHPLLRATDERPILGVLRTDQGPLLIASRPILTSTRQGPARGWLVLGKLLNEALRATLAERAGLEFALLDWRQIADARDQEAAAALTAGATNVQDPDSDTRLSAWSMIRDVGDEPLLLLRASLPRDVAARGRAATSSVLWACLTAGAVLLAALLWLLQRLVVAPVTALTRHAVAIGKDDALQQRIRSPRRDELGVLAREFDTMVDRLAESRSRVIELARRGGQAEVAGEVLHNVGNVLNSVNVARDALQQQLGAVDRRTLDQVLGLLRTHQHDLAAFIADDQAGRHLPRFLQVLFEQIVSSTDAARSELQQLRDGIEQMRALVAAQREYAGASGVAERVEVNALVERALAIAVAKVPEVAFAAVVPAGTPAVVVEQHRVIEVLSNLAINAGQATRGYGGPNARVEVRGSVSGERLRLEVVDHGIGIAAEALPKLFQQGYTTRSEGQGLGLHSAANTVRALGGDIGATSDGPGRGACFWFTLPVGVRATGSEVS